MSTFVHGFFPTSSSDLVGIGELAEEPLTTGVSVVVPVERVLEIVDSQAFVEQRQAVKKRLDVTGQTPTPVRLEQDLELVRLDDLTVGHVTAREAGLIAMITEQVRTVLVQSRHWVSFKSPGRPVPVRSRRTSIPT